MVYVMLHLNSSFTVQFFPFFEIVYSIEIFFILIFYALVPVAFYMLWNARPFHRNLRLSLCNLVIQGVLGTTARLIFVYNQYYGEGPLEDRSSVIIASLLRSSMFEAFIGAFIFFSFERLIATFAWSWYEKESPHTLVVFIVLEGCAMIWSWAWSITLVFEYVRTKDWMIGITCSCLVGCVAGLLAIAVNYRETVSMKAGARVNRYSVARTFQIRENVVILTALVKIAISLMFLNVPLFFLGICFLFLPSYNDRMLARAIFDLIISIYPFMAITYIPLSDVIFERSLKRIPVGDLLFRIFRVIRCSRRKTSKIAVLNEADHYFNTLAMSLSGPPKR